MFKLSTQGHILKPTPSTTPNNSEHNPEHNSEHNSEHSLLSNSLLSEHNSEHNFEHYSEHNSEHSLLSDSTLLQKPKQPSKAQAGLGNQAKSLANILSLADTSTTTMTQSFPQSGDSRKEQQQEELPGASILCSAGPGPKVKVKS